MKDKNRFYRRPYKVIAVVLHVLCIAVLIGGVIAGRLVMEKGYGNPGRILSQKENYENTKEFGYRFYDDAQSVVELTWMKEIFETNGNLDMSKPALVVKNTDGSTKTYSLKDLASVTMEGNYYPAGDGSSYGSYYGSAYNTGETVVIQGGTDYSDYMDMLDEEYESVLEELEELEMQASNYTDEEMENEYTAMINELYNRLKSISDEMNEYSSNYENTYDNWYGYGYEGGSWETVEAVWFVCNPDNPLTYTEGNKENVSRKSSLYYFENRTADLLNRYNTLNDRFMDNPSNLEFIVNGSLSLKNTAHTAEELQSTGRYVTVTGDGSSYRLDQNLGKYQMQQLVQNAQRYHVLEDNKGSVTVAVNTSFGAEDVYAEADRSIRQLRETVKLFCILVPIAAFMFLLTLIYMIRGAGKNVKTGEIKTNWLDGWPLEVLLLACVGGIFILGLITRYYIGNYMFYGNYDLVLFTDSALGHVLAVSVQLVLNGIWYLLGLTTVLSLIRRKRKKKWNAVILPWLYKRAKEACRVLSVNTKLSTQVLFLFLIWTLGAAALTGIFVAGVYQYGFGYNGRYLGYFCLVLLAAGLLATAAFLVRKAIQRDRILEGTGRIAKGDVDYKLDLAKLSGGEKELADQINHISDGLQTAVETAMKSERMKTELITNVSHDIKTPLTSIINYVDLLKRENIEDEKVSQYLSVLEQKSNRLKVLTEDLVEASKASSGNLALEMETLDFVQLVTQVNGEFAERFGAKDLRMMADLPNQPVYIKADGRRVWRILDNLYGNVVKYALEHTRVYISVEPGGSGASVSFVIKNISATPITMDAAELTERFVRGDLSRTSDGSGLGLSIAKSLTELQNGSFEIYLDGDLFRVTVTFPAVSES